MRVPPRNEAMRGRVMKIPESSFSLYELRFIEQAFVSMPYCR